MLEWIISENVALGKKARQISEDLPASHAVDGVTSGKLGQDQSCSKTTIVSDPWFEVDLGDHFYIKRVVLFNRNSDNNAGK